MFHLPHLHPDTERKEMVQWRILNLHHTHSGASRPRPYEIRLTTSFCNWYCWLLSGHVAIPFSLKARRCPYSLTQPIRRDGLPTTKAYGGISLVTTAPAPIMAYSPTVWPQTIVAFAPIEAPFPTCVSKYRSLRETALRGLTTFVKTQLGPRKTSSPQVTPV